MPLNGFAQEGYDASDVEQLRRKLQQMIGESQAFFVGRHEYLIEYKRDNGRSESGIAEGSAA